MEKAKAGARKVAGLRKLRWKDVVNYWINDGPKAVFIFLFFVANFAIMAERFVCANFPPPTQIIICVFKIV